MFYHQKVARVRVFADIQNFALHAHCVHGIPKDTVFGRPSSKSKVHKARHDCLVV